MNSQKKRGRENVGKPLACIVYAVCKFIHTEIVKRFVASFCFGSAESYVECHEAQHAFFPFRQNLNTSAFICLVAQ